MAIGYSRAALARTAAVSAVVTAVIGAGANFVLNKQTPTGATAGSSIFVLRTSSGGQVVIVDEVGNASFSGSIKSGGSTLTTAGASDARYVNTSGDTMTGALKVRSTASGTIVHADNTLASSGTLTVKGEPRIQRVIALPLCDAVTACATGSGVIVRISKMMNNYAFSGATLDAAIAGTTGTMSVQVINITDGTNLFSTNITLDSAEVSSDTAATPYVRNATLGERTVTDGDRIMVRVDAVHTTPAKGVTINLHFIPL